MKKIITVIINFLIILSIQARVCPVCCGSGQVRSLRYTRNGSTFNEVTCTKCDGLGEIKNSNIHTFKNYKKELEERRQYLRKFVDDNNISCSNRMQLSEIATNLIQRCLKEDDEIKEIIKSFEFNFEFPTTWVTYYTPYYNKDNSKKFIENSILIINNPLDSKYTPSDKLYKEYTSKKIALGLILLKNTKEFCEVHKWDDECCPTFGGDYFTYDIKTKYAQNKIKAYELASKGIIKCTCDNLFKHKLKRAAEIKELDKKYEECSLKIKNFEIKRTEDLKKLNAISEAFKQFEKIIEISNMLRRK